MSRSRRRGGDTAIPDFFSMSIPNITAIVSTLPPLERNPVRMDKVEVKCPKFDTRNVVCSICGHYSSTSKTSPLLLYPIHHLFVSTKEASILDAATRFLAEEGWARRIQGTRYFGPKATNLLKWLTTASPTPIRIAHENGHGRFAHRNCANVWMNLIQAFVDPSITKRRKQLQDRGMRDAKLHLLGCLEESRRYVEQAKAGLQCGSCSPEKFARCKAEESRIVRIADGLASGAVSPQTALAAFVDPTQLPNMEPARRPRSKELPPRAVITRELAAGRRALLPFPPPPPPLPRTRLVVPSTTPSTKEKGVGAPSSSSPPPPPPPPPPSLPPSLPLPPSPPSSAPGLSSAARRAGPQGLPVLPPPPPLSTLALVAAAAATQTAVCERSRRPSCSKPPAGSAAPAGRSTRSAANKATTTTKPSPKISKPKSSKLAAEKKSKKDCKKQKKQKKDKKGSQNQKTTTTPVSPSNPNRVALNKRHLQAVTPVLASKDCPPDVMALTRQASVDWLTRLGLHPPTPSPTLPFQSSSSVPSTTPTTTPAVTTTPTPAAPAATTTPPFPLPLPAPLAPQTPLPATNSTAQTTASPASTVSLPSPSDEHDVQMLDDQLLPLKPSESTFSKLCAVVKLKREASLNSAPEGESALKRAKSLGTLEVEAALNNDWGLLRRSSSIPGATLTGISAAGVAPELAPSTTLSLLDGLLSSRQLSTGPPIATTAAVAAAAAAIDRALGCFGPLSA